jgi:hypothetical protein
MNTNPLSLSPLHAPLGIPLSDDVEPELVSVVIDETVRASFSVSMRKPTLNEFNSDFVRYTSGFHKNSETGLRDSISVPEFDCAIEEQRMKLARCGKLLIEPFSCLEKAVDSILEEDGIERLKYTPSILSYFSRELGYHPHQPVTVSSGSSNQPVDPLVDICSDSYYSTTKKTENVETPVPENSTQPDSDQPTPPPSSVAVITSDGISVAHAPCAYDLAGSFPWACYTKDTFTPIMPRDIRYHRVHICSPNTDKLGAVWPVFGPRASAPLEFPKDGSCPFKSSSQLSLRDTCEFVLMESIEQSPLLMHFHGMSGAIFRYITSAKPGGKCPIQGQLIKLDPANAFVPRVFGGSVVPVPEDTECWIFESSLIRAPIFWNKSNITDFLLVRSRNPTNKAKSASGVPFFHCTLRAIDNTFTVGQAEPLYRIDVPVVPRLHQVLSMRVQVECRRFWLRAKSLPGMDFVMNLFMGERRSLLQRYYSDAMRDIQQRPGAPLTPALSPEEACVVAGMKEGLRRLAERGIERIFAISPMRIRNYVRDIEMFERSIPANSKTPRIAHYCVQVENEMRSSPWNLTNDYWDVMTGKRGAMFQFSPLGDPSGGRGEGISFRKILKLDNVSTLSDIAGTTTTTKPIEMDDIRSKSKRELVEELQKLNVPERMWRGMSRWQLMRQLALLHGIEDHAEERFAPWKRKALHTEKIHEAWKKQTKALVDPVPPSDLAPASTTPNSEDNTPEDSGTENDNLESMMLDELMEGGDDHPDSPTATNTITRLQIVSAGRVKSTGSPWSKVTYVYGDRNIALYRKWKELEEEGSFGVAAGDGSHIPSVSGWQAKVELALKVHRRFQRVIKQAAESSRPIPDVKRCGSCHLFGHDSSYSGCPIMVREMGEAEDTAGSRKRKTNLGQQSPVYD